MPVARCWVCSPSDCPSTSPTAPPSTLASSWGRPVLRCWCDCRPSSSCASASRSSGAATARSSRCTDAPARATHKIGAMPAVLQSWRPLGLISPMTERQRPYDEMLDAEGAPRMHCRQYYGWLREQPAEHLARKRAEADALFHRVGITFAVYGENEGTERLIPFDIVPRIMPAPEWQRLEQGLKQRGRALNAFLADVYHEQRILKAQLVPPEQILCNPQYRPEMQGVNLPGGIYTHISGIDVVRDYDGSFCVLEDNLRVPSGVSYMLENRKMMMRLFPELFARDAIEPVEHYPDVLHENLKSVAPVGVTDPTVVLLTPGAYNSAYFEHAFLAQQMGIELVEGQDLL